MLLRKIKQESEIKYARGWTGISVRCSGKAPLRRQHLSRDLKKERGALQVSGGRAPQAEERARAKPGVGIYLLCTRNKKEGSRGRAVRREGQRKDGGRSENLLFIACGPL